jgi:hypothetical protein
MMALLAYGPFAFPIHDDARGAFVTRPHHTRRRDDDVQPIVEGAMKHLKQVDSVVGHLGCERGITRKVESCYIVLCWNLLKSVPDL